MTARAWYVGLDLGARTFTASAAARGYGGDVVALGYETVPSTGLERGRIVDPRALRRSVGTLIARVAEHLDADVTAVALTVPGSQCRRVATSAERRFEVPTRIDMRPVQELRLRSLRVPAAAGPVLASAIRARVDGQRWPAAGQEGWGQHLRVDTEAWVVPSAYVEGYERVVAPLGLSIDLLMPRVSAAGAAALHPTEVRRGALAIDVGEVESDVAVYGDGALRALFTVPLGLGPRRGKPGHEYRDVQRQIHAGAARRGEHADLTGRRASATGTLGSVNPGPIGLPGQAGSESLALFRQVRRRLEELDLTRAMGGGAVLIGEGAGLPEVSDAAARALELPVRVGRALGPEGGPGGSDPGLAAVIGLVLTQARTHADDAPAPRPVRTGPDLAQASVGDPKASALGRWLREFVPVGEGT